MFKWSRGQSFVGLHALNNEYNPYRSRIRNPVNKAENSTLKIGFNSISGIYFISKAVT